MTWMAFVLSITGMLAWPAAIRAASALRGDHAAAAVTATDPGLAPVAKTAVTALSRVGELVDMLANDESLISWDLTVEFEAGRVGLAIVVDPASVSDADRMLLLQIATRIARLAPR